MFKTKAKTAITAKLIVLFMAFALLAGCVASGKHLERSVYSDDDFDNSDTIRVVTDQLSYPRGTDSISYTVTNNSGSEVYYGISYSVEMKRNDQWYQVPFKESTAWIAIAYMLDSGDSQSYQADLSLLRFDLSQGEYRLVKQIGEKLYSAEFSIGD